MSYEFSDQDANVISIVGIMAIVIAGLIALGGLMRIVTSFYNEAYTPFELTLRTIQNLIQFVMGLLFIPAALSFRRVATTEGSDIPELLTGTDNMTKAFYVIIAMIALSVVIDVILLL